MPIGAGFDRHGFDEMDEVHGEGWVELQEGRSVIGALAHDNGDESDIRAVPS